MPEIVSSACFFVLCDRFHFGVNAPQYDHGENVNVVIAGLVEFGDDEL